MSDTRWIAWEADRRKATEDDLAEALALLRLARFAVEHVALAHGILDRIDDLLARHPAPEAAR